MFRIQPYWLERLTSHLFFEPIRLSNEDFENNLPIRSQQIELISSLDGSKPVDRIVCVELEKVLLIREWNAREQAGDQAGDACVIA